MTIESQGFLDGLSNAKASAREFNRWLTEQDQSAWPDDLKAKAFRALLTLKSLDQPTAHKSEAFMAESKKDLADFAAAYAEWIASKPDA